MPLLMSSLILNKVGLAYGMALFVDSAFEGKVCRETDSLFCRNFD
jgi:hypothetical protein